MIKLEKGFIDRIFDEIVEDNPYKVSPIYREPPHLSYIIANDGVPVGMLILKHFPVNYYNKSTHPFCMIGLLDEYQGEGLGYEALAQLSKMHPGIRVNWSVESTNLPSLKLLNKMEGGIYDKYIASNGHLVYKGFFYTDGAVEDRWRNILNKLISYSINDRDKGDSMSVYNHIKQASLENKWGKCDNPNPRGDGTESNNGSGRENRKKEVHELTEKQKKLIKTLQLLVDEEKNEKKASLVDAVEGAVEDAGNYTDEAYRQLAAANPELALFPKYKEMEAKEQEIRNRRLDARETVKDVYGLGEPEQGGGVGSYLLPAAIGSGATIGGLGILGGINKLQHAREIEDMYNAGQRMRMLRGLNAKPWYKRPSTLVPIGLGVGGALLLKHLLSDNDEKEPEESGDELDRLMR